MTTPTTTTLHERLAAELERRLAVARAATAGPWWDSPVLAAPGHHTIRGGPDDFRGFDGSLGGDTRPVARIEPAPDYEGEFVTNHDADAAHIALHDPADAIRRYVGEREVLQRHAPVDDDEGHECGYCLLHAKDEELYLEAACFTYPCAEIRSLAARLGVSVDG